MKNIFLTTTLLLLSFIGFSQNIQLEFFFENVKDSTKISFNKPIDSNYKNYFYNCEVGFTDNNYLKKTLNLDESGVIMINPGMSTPKIYLILSKGNKIKINLKRDNNNFKIKFEGDNAEGLDELYNSPYLTHKKLALIIGDLIPESKNNTDIIEKIEKIKIKSLTTFNKLLAEKKISVNFYKTLKLQVDLLFLETTYDIIAFYTNEVENFKKQKNSIEELNKVIFELDRKYNAFDEKYKYCDGITKSSAVEKKCNFINKNILTGTKHDIGLWDLEQQQYNYAPLKSQEILMANNISMAGFEAANCTYEQFKKIFPKSLYLKKLNSLDYESKLSNNIAMFSIAVFNDESKKITYIENKEYNDLSKLINERYKDKYVFVDIWASYCAPCKKEFTYAKDLIEFLNKNKIELLYVSVDNPSQIKKWEKDIYEYDLKGTHYFASNSILPNLKSLLGEEKDVYIPRYLFFNGDGKLILKNAKKPSEGENLFSQILKAIK